MVPPVMEGAFPAAGNPFGSGGPLVGRDAELERIDASLSGSVRSGRPLLLLADAGVGKTALPATAADRAAARGMRVLAATGVEYRAGLSYGGLVQLLGAVAAGGRRGEHLAPAIDALFLLGNHAWLTGQWPELRESVREGLELCEQYHYPLLAWPGTYLLACAAAVRGDHTAVRDLTDRMERWAGPRRAETVRVYGAHARALSALGRRDFEEVYRQAAFIAPAGTLPEFAPHALWAFMDLVEAAVRTGRREQAREHVAEGRAADLGALSPRLRMVLHACSALAAGDEGHPGFQEALAVEGATRWPFTWPASTCTTASGCGGTGRPHRRESSCAPRWRSSGGWAPTRGPTVPSRSCAPAAAPRASRRRPAPRPRR
ncbi:ATP-binding protein [Streptomyces sp. NPDC056257]|uniref:ATP-binding protein n=1 Tax=Streptomyces sp. NPDC056257 TaxID=3345765 RepID=UPI0035DDD33C